MRAIAVHPDVVVTISGVWQTTCTAVRSGDEAFVIDSPLLPDELEALPSVLEQAHFPVSGLLATHGDWDHLLGRLAFPGASLGVGETTAKRLETHLSEPLRALREFDAEWYITRTRPLTLGEVQALPVPGRLSIGSQGGSQRGASGEGAHEARATGTDTGNAGGAGETGAGRAGASGEIELYPADGHTADGVAFWIPWASVLVCGDYISPVEIPMISPEHGGTLRAYRETLMRLAPLVGRAASIVPGHGAPLDSRQAAAIIREDVAYLDALAAGRKRPLPKGRSSSAQRRVHTANVAAVATARRSGGV